MLLIGLQLFIAAAMFDVWLVRYNRPVMARGGNAKTMVEEFRVYGLPDWLRQLVRGLKLGSGALMVVGVWYAPAALVAGAILTVLMAAAILMHFKVRDPLYKALPATLFFALACYVSFAHRALILG